MTETRYSRTVAVLTEVMEERAAQDLTWGEQNHPLHDPISPDGVVLMGRSYAALELMMKARFAEHRSGAVILLEEVFEALAAKDLVHARTELVQVAAVAVMLVEGIDRARATGQTAADRRGNIRPCNTVASPLVTGEGTRQHPVGKADDDHPRGWGAKQTDAVGPSWAGYRHPAQSSSVAGVCQCGEEFDHPVHDTGGE